MQEGPRDSITTHHSSYYPQSTSSYSNTSPPSPSSPSASSFAASIQTGTDADATSLDPHHPHHVLLDPDDVSYRLKLLVRNNYFLPPAHSKPSQSELAAAAGHAAQAQGGSPNTANKPFFRDIFRVGKVKSSAIGIAASRPMQAATQQQAQQQTARSVRHANAPVPPLRQAKSTNALVRPSHTRNPTNLSSSTTSRTLSVTAAGGGPVERRGRVVVIRETVEDIQIAAKEAEIQMRVQQQVLKEDVKDGGAKAGSSRKSARGGEDSEDEDDEEFIVDPTDAVDLPSYSFQPMASGLVGLGLGVDASGLNAGVLADQLPPPSSPTFGMTKEDMLWRKALLHQAVGLSMMSIPAPSSSSSSTNTTPQTTRTRKKSTTKDSVSSSTPQVNSSAPPSSSLGRSSGGKLTKQQQQQATPKSLASKSPLPTNNVQQPILEDLASAVAASRTNASGTVKPRKLTLPTDNRLDRQEEGMELPLGGGEGAISPGGRGRSTSFPHVSPRSRHQALEGEIRDQTQYRVRPSSRHRASPAPQRSETPLVPSMPLQPPPRKMGLGLKPTEPTIPQSPLSPNAEDHPERKFPIQRRSDEAAHPPRTHSPLFPTLDNGETIRKTLTRPLLSEGYESEHTTRSSDYFTPFSPSFVVSSPNGNRRELGEGVHESRTFDTITSGSYYSEDGEQGDELHDLRTSISRTERSSYQNPMSPISQTHESRQSNESGTTRTRPSGESTTGSSAQPRASLAESHSSMFSTSFGPIGGRQTPARPSRSPSRQRSAAGLRPDSAGKSEDGLIQAPPPELMVQSASGSESLASSPALPPPRPQRASTTPGPSALAWRRSQHLRPLDLLSVASLGPSQGGIRSAPPVETNEGSFLDLDAPHSATPFGRNSWIDEEPEGLAPGAEGDSTVVYVDNARMRSRLPSNAATIVPSPMKGMFAAPSASGSQQDHGSPSTRPIAMHFPNASNPYLQKPFADIDPSMPLTNTLPVTQPTFLSNLASGFSLIGNRKDKKSKDASDATGSLLQYARDPKARSTPTLSPSTKVFAEIPGRRSNVSGTRGRFGHGIIAEADLDPAMPRTSRDDPVLGRVAQHIQAERDLLKKVARGAARTDRE